MGNTYTDLQRGFCGFRPCHKMGDFLPPGSRTWWIIHHGWRNSQFYTNHFRFNWDKGFIWDFTAVPHQHPLSLLHQPKNSSWCCRHIDFGLAQRRISPVSSSPSARAGSGQGQAAPPFWQPLQPLSYLVRYSFEHFLRIAPSQSQRGSFADLAHASLPVSSFAWARQGCGHHPKKQHHVPPTSQCETLLNHVNQRIRRIEEWK